MKTFFKKIYNFLFVPTEENAEKLNQMMIKTAIDMYQESKRLDYRYDPMAEQDDIWIPHGHKGTFKFPKD